MSTATLSSKGQITIPVDVREALGLSAGDRVEFVETAPGQFAILPATQSVRRLKGLIRPLAAPVTLDAMNATIEAEGARAR